jgi:hypothetical protein
MAQHFLATIGFDNIQPLYEMIFKTISLRVEFTIHEIHETASEWAWARTSSAGTQASIPREEEQRGKFGVIRAQEDRRRMEDCSVLFLYKQ